jgi:hypothetical protein
MKDGVNLRKQWRDREKRLLRILGSGLEKTAVKGYDGLIALGNVFATACGISGRSTRRMGTGEPRSSRGIADNHPGVHRLSPGHDHFRSPVHSDRSHFAHGFLATGPGAIGSRGPDRDWFLGAGAIIRHADSIRGVTTAATLWFVTVLGLAFGSGEFGIGAAGVVLALVTLYVLPAFEKHIPSEWYGKLSVTFGATAFKVDQLKARIEATGLVIKSMHLSFDVEKQCRTVICEVKVKRSRVHPLSTQLVEELAGCDGVIRVRWF